MHPIQISIRKYAQKEKIPVYMNFFKTAKGQYGEGDIFIGVTVPNMRKVSKEYMNAELRDLVPILNSKVHEDRAVALSILVNKFQKASKESEKKKIVDFYIKYHLCGNNWDLVDGVADKILGAWLINKDKKILYDYAKSSNLWERRISIISTYYFIKNNKFDDTIKISKILLFDKEDLIQKATGWMLREVGKKDIKLLENFLLKYHKVMPRTMLRYAIEKFPQSKRKAYLNGLI